MKKSKFNTILIVVIIVLFIIEIYILALNNKYKYDIAKIIGIGNVNDFYIKKIERSYGPGTDPIFVTFKISIDNYNKYTLNYYDVEKDKDFYEGEITNKKRKVDNYYICCYETFGYNTENIKIINKAKNNIIQLKFTGAILIILIILFIIRTVKIRMTNNISSEN
ncbi:MAG: hypothetical protein IJE05_00515 [Clostridia bacterium]|nr:hypothetical protein [Clostridia bacterium]